MYKHELIYKTDLKAVLCTTHCAYTQRFLKIIPDDGDAESLTQFCTFQTTLWTVVKKIVNGVLHWHRQDNLLLRIALVHLQNLICKKKNSTFISVAKIGSPCLLFCLLHALYFLTKIHGKKKKEPLVVENMTSCTKISSDIRHPQVYFTY